jgi:phosphoglycerol transferase MdoB-like AlkP superfamily enzyme
LRLFYAYLLFVAMLALAHCIFQILYLTTPAPAFAWLVMLRFTLATVAAALFLPGLVYILSPAGGRLRRAMLWLIGIITYYCFTILVGDLVYYGQAGKHATVELLLFYQNIVDVSLMALKDYTYVPVIYLISFLVFVWLWQRIVARERQHSHPRRLSYAKRAIILVVFVLGSLVLARGGLQGRPLRPADAFVHLTQAQGDFALNGVYTSFYALFHRSNFPVRSDREAIERARALIAEPGDMFVNEETPFYRINRRGPARKKNVVFILLESWSAKRVGALGDTVKATPFFDSLAARGWLFTNAFATGRRSIASLPAAISSIPTLYGSLYITSPHEQNFQRGLGAILREVGYSTYFTYAAKAGSMGFNAFARLAGFEHIVTRESFPADAAHDGVWGIYDHVMFERALADMRLAKKPFVSVIYTLHPHPPFTLPPGDDYSFEPGADARWRAREKYYKALRYSDATLQRFFTAAEKEPWFRDTLFVLMADHAFEEMHGRDSYRIPLLFYAPDFIAPRRDHRIASELDVLPTILSLLRLPVAHAAMGKSLEAPGERFAFIDAEHAGGFITEKNGEQLVLLFGSERYEGYYNMSRDPQWQNLLRTAPLSADTMRALHDLIRVMGYAVAKNRIAPQP